MYNFNSRVRFSEVDAKKHLTLYGILNYFQDCSIFHSESAGSGIDRLSSQGYAWVLSSWQIVIDRYPTLGEEITIRTWPHNFKGFYGSRNFTIQDASGSIAAYANTLWSLIDLTSRTPAKIPPEILAAYPLEPAFPMENAPRKIKPFKGGIPKEPLTVRHFQIDANQHMNNAQYVLLAQEYLPEQVCVRQMRADYRKAAHLQDNIFPVVLTEGSVTTVSLNDETDSPYAIIEFIRR